MRRPDNSLDAEILLVCGGSGSGKSVWLKQHIAKAPRVLVFDVKREYGGQGKGFHSVYSPAELARAARRAGTGPGRYALVSDPDTATFDLFCRVAFAWGNCWVVAEELGSYTTAGKAPRGWHRCISQGRGFGLKIAGVTQRPSESDKTIVGNATLIHTGKLKRAGDRQYMAREMDIQQQHIDRLKPLEWIETGDKVSGMRSGKITF